MSDLYKVEKIDENMFKCNNLIYVLGISDLNPKSKDILIEICFNTHGRFLSPRVLQEVRNYLSKSSEFDGCTVIPYSVGLETSIIIQSPIGNQNVNQQYQL